MVTRAFCNSTKVNRATVRVPKHLFHARAEGLEYEPSRSDMGHAHNCLNIALFIILLIFLASAAFFAGRRSTMRSIERMLDSLLASKLPSDETDTPLAPELRRILTAIRNPGTRKAQQPTSPGYPNSTTSAPRPTR